MIRFVSLAVLAAVAFAAPAMAFDTKLTQKSAKTNTTTMAEGSGGAGSASGAIGGSALLGQSSIVVTNNANAAGNVTAQSKPGKSTLDQTYGTNNTTVLQTGSVGLAGNVGAGGGVAQVTGDGAAQTIQKTKINSVKLHF